LELEQKPIQAKAAMLIRRPVAEVYEAFIDPDITTKFWFTKSSGKLESGKEVTWEWEMYNVSSRVRVKKLEKNKRILIEWDGYNSPNLVEWTFTPYGNDATYLRITNSGFRGSRDEIVEQALDSTGGFTWLLAGLKAYLEHRIRLNLTADAHPKKLTEHGQKQ
jgi:uncharacterized protein YndB with AHSA1/START domain